MKRDDVEARIDATRMIVAVAERRYHDADAIAEPYIVSGNGAVFAYSLAVVGASCAEMLTEHTEIGSVRDMLGAIEALAEHLVPRSEDGR